MHVSQVEKIKVNRVNANNNDCFLVYDLTKYIYEDLGALFVSF